MVTLCSLTTDVFARAARAVADAPWHQPEGMERKTWRPSPDNSLLWRVGEEPERAAAQIFFIFFNAR